MRSITGRLSRISLLILSPLFLLPSLRAQEGPSFQRPEDAPLIETEPSSLDFGDLLKGERPRRLIEIRNKGKGDLVLLKISSTCGCTVTQVTLPSGEVVVPDKSGEKKVGILKPGEKAELNLELMTLGYQGMLKRQIAIHSNDPLNRNCAIPIQAMIKPSLTVEPPRFDFRGVIKGKEASRSVTIQSILAGPFSIAGFIDLPPYLDYDIEKIEDSEQPAYKVTLRLKGDVPLGRRNIVLKTDIVNEKVKELDLLVTVDIEAPISFATGDAAGKPILDFGVLQPDEECVKEIAVTNDNPAIPYTITGVTIDGKKHQEYLEAEVVPVEEGSRYTIRVKVKPGISSRFFQGTLKITSDHPDLPLKEIAFKGWISRN